MIKSTGRDEHGMQHKCGRIIYDFGGKARRKETTTKTKMSVGGYGKIHL
jgi:hypothetical protein